MKFYSRDDYHKQKWDKKIIWKENCPFCNPEQNEEYIVWKGKFWYILRNFSPYTWDENHLMAVPYEHIAFSTDLTIEHLKELELVHKFVAKYFAGRNYFSFTRESLSWRSVEHLHMHFLPWIIQGKYLRHMLMNQWFPIKQDL